MPIISTRGAAAARGFGFSGGGLFQVLLTITADTTDYNLYTAATGTGWPGAKDAQINLTINPGVNVHATSTGTQAMSVPSAFPAGSKVIITNAGIIVGRGGNGGNAQPAHGGQFNGTPGTPGGLGLLVNRPITLINNNRVAGGGGGGGGGGGQASLGRAYGGGGGGGITLGLGGSSHAGPHGTNATITAVGTSSGSFPGGTGGSYGAAGNNGTNAPDGTGGTGGSAGTAINGYSLITLSGTGQVNGPTTG
jgi:hypothetical protein